MDEVTTRRATAADAEALADLATRSYEGYLERMAGLRPAPMDADYATAIAHDTVWVAEVGGQVAGCLVLVDEPGSTLVENVAVDPGRQGRGIGGRLMAIAEDHARSTGKAIVRLYTHATMVENRRLYTHLGYAELDRRDDEGFDRVFFEKRISAVPGRP